MAIVTVGIDLAKNVLIERPEASSFSARSRVHGFTQQPSSSGDTLPTLRQNLMVVGPDVKHLRPNLQPHAYIGQARRAGECDRIIQQRLRGSHEDRQRRDATQIGENRRRERRLFWPPSQILLGQESHQLAIEDRISLRVAAVAVRGRCHVDPGREKKCASWLLHAKFFQSHEQRYRQARSRAIAGDRDLTRLEAGIQQEFVSADRIFQGVRKWELRSAPVIEGQRSHRGRATHLADEVPVALQ